MVLDEQTRLSLLNTRNPGPLCVGCHFSLTTYVTPPTFYFVGLHMLLLLHAIIPCLYT